jgi:hypothetical protein
MASALVHQKDRGQESDQSEIHGASSDNEVDPPYQLQPLLAALQAARAGDLSVRVPVQGRGVLTAISTAVHDMIRREEHTTKTVAVATFWVLLRP